MHRGPKGDKGDTWAQGPKGDTHTQGPESDTGAQEPKFWKVIMEILVHSDQKVIPSAQGLQGHLSVVVVVLQTFQLFYCWMEVRKWQVIYEQLNS